MDNDQEMTGTEEGDQMEEGDETEAEDEVSALAEQTADLHMDGSNNAGALDDKKGLERLEKIRRRQYLIRGF